MNGWLQENKTEECYAFLLELLKLYERLPVTIDLLKKNNCAKTVKQLSKAEDQRECSVQGTQSKQAFSV